LRTVAVDFDRREAVLIAGFIAGFPERLLPDLLEGRQAVSSPANAI
jgi:hypothetical protein